MAWIVSLLFISFLLYCKASDVILKDIIERNHGNFVLYSCNRPKSDFVKNITKQIAFRVLVGNFEPVENKKSIFDFRKCKGNYETALSKFNFEFPKKNYIVIEKNSFNDLIKFLETLDLLPMSEVIVISIYLNEAQLYSPYKIKSNSSLILENYGNWTTTDGLKTLNHIPLSRRRSNFHKQTLHLSTVVYKEHQITKSNLDDITRTQEHVFQQDAPILYGLTQKLNATFNIRTFTNHGYGFINRTTGLYQGDGVVYDLTYGEGDVSVALILTKDRLELVRYLSPAQTYGANFFLKKPSLSYVADIYTLTFAGMVWLAIAATCFLFFVVLFLILRCDDTLYKENSISDVILITISAFCQQGISTQTFTISGRIVMLLLFIVFMFVYVAYSAGILVLLRSNKRVEDLSELLRSRFDCGGLNSSFNRFYFEQPKKGVLRDLYLRKIYPDRYYEFVEGMKRVREGNFAFHVNVVKSYKYISKTFTNYDVCGLQELPGYMDSKMYYATPKTSPYREIFKVGFAVLQESGIQRRHKLKMVAKPKCHNESGNFQSVRMYDCVSVLVMFVIGLGAALAVWIVEIIYSKYRT